MTSTATAPVLTDRDRRIIANARGLAAATGENALIEHLTNQDLTPRSSENGGVYPYAFGVAKHLLEALADLAERLAAADITEASGA